MTEGQKQRPPPIPQAGARKSIPQSLKPAPESLISPKLLEALRSFIPGAVVDQSGEVSLKGKKIGELCQNRILILQESAGADIPVSLKLMAQAKKMTVFFEITESSVSACAGSGIGQKTIFLQIR